MRLPPRLTDEMFDHLADRYADDALNAARLRRAQLGLRDEERARYSLANALRCLQRQETRSGSFEGEISGALEKHRAVQTGNAILVPIWALRDLTASSAGAGGYLVETGVEIDGLAEVLRGTSVVATLPISSLSGATGNFAIPRETAAPTANVLTTEGSSATESTPTLGSVSMTPKTIAAYCELSKQFLDQTGRAGDAYVRRSLAKSIGAKLDQLALNGSGASGEPTGLLNTPGIGSVTGTSLSEAGIRELQTDIGDALGPDGGFVTSRATASLLNGRQRFTGSDRTLWEGNLYAGSVGGWPAYSSPSVPAATLAFGAWSSFVLATWGEAIEVSANPYTDFKARIIGVRAFASFDIGIVRPSAFSVAASIT